MMQSHHNAIKVRLVKVPFDINATDQGYISSRRVLKPVENETLGLFEKRESYARPRGVIDRRVDLCLSSYIH